MATYTKIVEFFGVPACGKSTIVNGFVEANGDVGKTVSYHTVCQDYLRSSFLKKLDCFPFYMLLNTWRLQKSIGSRFKSLNYLKNRYIPILKVLTCYCFAKKYSNYSMILVDHGIIQTVVSMIAGMDINNEDIFQSSLCQLFNGVDDITFVHCQLEFEEAVRRLSLRGEHAGRFQHTIDKDILLAQYKAEKERFDLVLNNMSNKRRIVNLNTSGTLKDVLHTLNNNL